MHVLCPNWLSEIQTWKMVRCTHFSHGGIFGAAHWSERILDFQPSRLKRFVPFQIKMSFLRWRSKAFVGLASYRIQFAMVEVFFHKFWLLSSVSVKLKFFWILSSILSFIRNEMNWNISSLNLTDAILVEIWIFIGSILYSFGQIFFRKNLNTPVNGYSIVYKLAYLEQPFSRHASYKFFIFCFLFRKISIRFTNNLNLDLYRTRAENIFSVFTQKSVVFTKIYMISILVDMLTDTIF